MDPVVAILAGGRSQRMGQPKPSVELGGRPLISYPLAAARAAGLEAWIVAKSDSELPPVDCQVLFEPDEPHHPLLGIVTALRAAQPSPVIAVAADMPFVEADLLRLLTATAATTAVEAGGRLQPLPARFAPQDLEALDRAVDAGAAATGVLAELEPETIGEETLRRFGDPERICFNVNSPADLERAERLLEA